MLYFKIIVIIIILLLVRCSGENKGFNKLNNLENNSYELSIKNKDNKKEDLNVLDKSNSFKDNLNSKDSVVISDVKDVPEPSSIIGLILIGVLLFKKHN